MNTHYHGTSHLGPMSIDRFVVAEPLPLRRQIEIALEVAANKAMNIHTKENEEAVLDLQEQLVILDAIDFGYIKPLPVRVMPEEGSDTSMETQLNDAGMGSAGVM